MDSVRTRRPSCGPSSPRPLSGAGTGVDLLDDMAKSRKRQDNGDTSVQDAPRPDAQSLVGNGGPPDVQRISTRAYERYLARGGSDGQDWDDWLEAERELIQETSGRSGGDTGE